MNVIQMNNNIAWVIGAEADYNFVASKSHAWDAWCLLTTTPTFAVFTTIFPLLTPLLIAARGIALYSVVKYPFFCLITLSQVADCHMEFGTRAVIHHRLLHFPSDSETLRNSDEFTWIYASFRNAIGHIREFVHFFFFHIVFNRMFCSLTLLILRAHVPTVLMMHSCRLANSVSIYCHVHVVLKPRQQD